MSRINAENMDLFGRLAGASAALGEAKLFIYSAKGWALWQKVSSEKNSIQQEPDAIREKNAQRDRQDKPHCAQAGVHHGNIKTSVARMQNDKAATEAELQEARNAEAVPPGNSVKLTSQQRKLKMRWRKRKERFKPWKLFRSAS